MRALDIDRTWILDATIRLRIATRIHFALLRQYGEDVPVSSLLKNEGDAREALWVCLASGHDELVALARQFEAATPDAARARRAEAPPPRAAAPQDMAWSQDTSGFGVSRPGVLGAPEATRARWPSTPRWLRFTSARPPR